MDTLQAALIAAGIGVIAAFGAVLIAAANAAKRFFDDYRADKAATNAANWAKAVVMDDPSKAPSLEQVPDIVAAGRDYLEQQAPKTAIAVSGAQIVARTGVAGDVSANMVEDAIAVGNAQHAKEAVRRAVDGAA